MQLAALINKAIPVSSEGKKNTGMRSPCFWMSLVCLGGILILPSGVEAALDGLPWMKPGEALIVAAALPLLLLFNRKWLSCRPAALFIAGLFFLKGHDNFSGSFLNILTSSLYIS